MKDRRLVAAYWMAALCLLVGVVYVVSRPGEGKIGITSDSRVAEVVPRESAPASTPLQVPSSSSPTSEEEVRPRLEVTDPPTAPMIAEPLAQDVDTPAAARLVVDARLLPWEAAMLQIMKAPASHAVKSRALFALLPQLPEEALGTATEQAAYWLRDADYANLAGPVVANPSTHGTVLTTLFADLMERPDAIALPTLLQIARSPGHPFAESARDNLSLLLDQNLGSDWGAWDQVIRQRIRGGQ